MNKVPLSASQYSFLYHRLGDKFFTDFCAGDDPLEKYSENMWKKRKGPNSSAISTELFGCPPRTLYRTYRTAQTFINQNAGHVTITIKPTLYVRLLEYLFFGEKFKTLNLYSNLSESKYKALSFESRSNLVRSLFTKEFDDSKIQIDTSVENKNSIDDDELQSSFFKIIFDRADIFNSIKIRQFFLDFFNSLSNREYEEAWSTFSFRFQKAGIWDGDIKFFEDSFKNVAHFELGLEDIIVKSYEFRKINVEISYVENGTLLNTNRFYKIIPPTKDYIKLEKYSVYESEEYFEERANHLENTRQPNPVIDRWIEKHDKLVKDYLSRTRNKITSFPFPHWLQLPVNNFLSLENEILQDPNFQKVLMISDPYFDAPGFYSGLLTESPFEGKHYSIPYKTVFACTINKGKVLIDNVISTEEVINPYGHFSAP